MGVVRPTKVTPRIPISALPVCMGICRENTCMTYRRLLLPAAILLIMCWTMAGSIVAQETDGQKAVADSDHVEDWYYRSPSDLAPEKTIAQQKAEFRAQQRMGRLAAQRWYGYSNARPQVAAVPFTAMYRSAWQRPGGWPYRWYTNHTVVVITR